MHRRGMGRHYGVKLPVTVEDIAALQARGELDRLRVDPTPAPMSPLQTSLSYSLSICVALSRGAAPALWAQHPARTRPWFSPRRLTPRSRSARGQRSGRPPPPVRR